MEELNLIISKALKSERILPRPFGSPGLWISFLLPWAVIWSCLNTRNVSEAYISYAIYSFNSLLNAIYLMFHIYQYKSINVANKFNILCAVPVYLTSYLYSHFLNMDFKRTVCYVIANSVIYFEGITFLFKAFPNAFTFGEVSIAIQGLSLFMYCFFLRLNYVLQNGVPNTEEDASSFILLLILWWILVFCIVPFAWRSLRRVGPMYVWGITVVGMIYFSIYHILNLEFFHWIWLFLTKPKRIRIVSMWMVCSVSAVATVLYHTSVNKKSSTIIRKFFHILVVAVFLPGILLDPYLLYFSSGCVLGLFVILEAFRILSLPPLHQFLNAGFSVYCDEKDSGNLALTPICLLIGTSLPLWLNPQKFYSREMNLPLLSGVLSVGVGDTFASIGGKLFGKHKWKGSTKTIEGTIFCILSQVIFVLMLAFGGIIEITTQEFLKILLSIGVTSIVEAKTDQIDNIVLPLTMYILLMT